MVYSSEKKQTITTAPTIFSGIFLAYFVLRGAEGLELGLVVVEARVLGHEVVVRFVFVVFPQPVVPAKG